MNIEVVETKKTTISEELTQEELVVLVDHYCDLDDGVFEIYIGCKAVDLSLEDMEKFSKVIKKALALQAK